MIDLTKEYIKIDDKLELSKVNYHGVNCWNIHLYWGSKEPCIIGNIEIINDKYKIVNILHSDISAYGEYGKLYEPEVTKYCGLMEEILNTNAKKNIKT